MNYTLLEYFVYLDENFDSSISMTSKRIEFVSLAESSKRKRLLKPILKDIYNASVNIRNSYMKVMPLLNGEDIAVIKIPKQLADDLLNTLSLMYPLNIIDLNEVAGKMIKGYSKDHTDFDEYKFKLDIYLKDIQSCIRSYRSSDYYKRISKGKYSKDNLVLVPIKEIEADIQKSKEIIDNFSSRLDYINTLLSEYRIIYDDNLYLFVEVCKEMIELFNDRLSILQIFSKYVQESIKDIKKVYNSDISNIPNINAHYDKFELLYVILSISKFDELKKLYKDLVKFNKSHKILDCKKAYKKMLNILEFTEPCSLIFNEAAKYINKNEVTLRINVRKEIYNKINISGKTLYHQSSIEEIKEIYPTHMTMNNIILPEPRVYAHIENILDRNGEKVSTDLAATSDDSIYMGDVIYELNCQDLYAYSDPNHGKTAVFIITDKPIKVKRQLDPDDLK